jgi:hypothetical protein
LWSLKSSTEVANWPVKALGCVKIRGFVDIFGWKISMPCVPMNDSFFLSYWPWQLWSTFGWGLLIFNSCWDSCPSLGSIIFVNYTSFVEGTSFVYFIGESYEVPPVEVWVSTLCFLFGVPLITFISWIEVASSSLIVPSQSSHTNFH